MASDWVTPLAVAATGIAGVAFTWLASRQSSHTQLKVLQMQQTHEGSRFMRTERRDYFAQYLAAFDDLQGEIGRSGTLIEDVWPSALSETKSHAPAYNGGPPTLPDETLALMDPDGRSAAGQALDEVWAGRGRLMGQRENVQLCGSLASRQAVEAVDREVMSIIAMMRGGSYRYISRQATDAILSAFRLDLGYETTVESDQAPS